MDEREPERVGEHGTSADEGVAQAGGEAAPQGARADGDASTDEQAWLAGSQGDATSAYPYGPTAEPPGRRGDQGARAAAPTPAAPSPAGASPWPDSAPSRPEPPPSWGANSAPTSTAGQPWAAPASSWGPSSPGASSPAAGGRYEGGLEPDAPVADGGHARGGDALTTPPGGDGQAVPTYPPGGGAVPTSTVVLLVVSAVAFFTGALTIPSVPSGILAVVAATSASRDLDRAERLTRLGWILLVGLTVAGLLLLVLVFVVLLVLVPAAISTAGSFPLRLPG
ncbi:hypothetical protein [Pseudokineococcus sp. 1T1Z-3]|uniref:hypothetical protein n=1 Tax=Pseudokineococcus sp. 1T1Z-3 TaxID=3132745 RepID=UPI0030A57249